MQKALFPLLSLSASVIEAQTSSPAQISEVPVGHTGASVLYINCPQFCCFYLDKTLFKSHTALPVAKFGPEPVTCHELPVCSCLGVTKLKVELCFLEGGISVIFPKCPQLCCVFFSWLWSQPSWKAAALLVLSWCSFWCCCCRVSPITAMGSCVVQKPHQQFLTTAVPQ